MDLAATIDQILAQRRPLADRVLASRVALDRLAAALDGLEAARSEALGEVEGPAAQPAKNRLGALELDRARLGLEKHRAALLRLETRLRRDHLVVGVVGRARQGKSRLLQSITGLGPDVIPDGDRTHCTGVRSTLAHRAGVEPHAEVFLHTERSFLDEVVAPYHAELPELGPAPRSLDAWTRPAEKERLVGSRGAKIQHLQRAFDLLPRYRALLGAPSPRKVPLPEVRRWVAQTSENGDVVFAEHMAVREVVVTCSFPHPELARLSVVDMPGLGDTGVGDEARLLHTLGHAVDAVLFVRLPKALGDHWADVDLSLYDLARRALPELPIERWSAFVLNRTALGSGHGDNLKNCEDLARGAKAHGLAALFFAIADASDPDDAHRRVLAPMLDHLAQHGAELDRSYAAAAQAGLLEAIGEAEAVLAAAGAALAVPGASDRENPLYRRLFEDTWEELGAGLEGYLTTLSRRRHDEDPDLAQMIEVALGAARESPGIPEIAAIERRRHGRGSYAIVYNELLNEVRAELSRGFLRLDDGLKRSLQAVKDGLGETLRKILGGIGPGEGAAFLRTVRERLPPEAAGLAEGFDMLLGFDLSYRGLIQHRVRQHLDGLTPDLTSLTLSARPDADEVRTYLFTLHQEAIYRAEIALRGLLYEPNQAAFAMVEELLDRVLRARGARAEWDIFLYEARAEVWRGEFDRIEHRARTRRRWEEAVRLAVSAADRAAFAFLDP